MSNKEPITVEGLKKLSEELVFLKEKKRPCLLYTSPSPRDKRQGRMPSSA